MTLVAGSPVRLDWSGRKAETWSWLPPDEIEPETLQQIRDIGSLDVGVRVAVMPDAHKGYGMPIGCMLATQDAVVPYAVGVDIGCFTGDTEVLLVDGKQHRLSDLASKAEEFCVYSCTPTGRVVAARATGRLTRRSSELLRVTVDNGRAIRCTPDQKFMLRDGTYARADALAPGTSLMPLYADTDGEGYARVQQPYSGRWQRAHWLVARSGLLGVVPKFEEGRTVIHHRNFDESDNRPENLEFMSVAEHSRYHRLLVERNGHWQSAQFEAARVAALAAKAATPDGRRFYSERGTRNILAYMSARRAEFLAAIAGNGQRGRRYLIEYNQSPTGREKSRQIAAQLHPCPDCGLEIRSWIGLHNHRRWTHGRNLTNHVVVSVELLDEREDVYCLQVPTYGNFALSAGVFVHNCGMIAAKTTVDVARITPERVREALAGIYKSVPVGQPTRHDKKQGSFETRQDSVALHEWWNDGGRDDPVLRATRERADRQVGTLGGGNHFVELQADADGALWLMLHTGSRSFGKAVCDRWHAEALARCTDEGVALPNRELAYLDVRSEAGTAYLRDMGYAMRYAEESRARIYEKSIEALRETFGALDATGMLETHHNFAATESHDGRDVIVHRKGAVRTTDATGAGVLVTIPGSMQTGSYIGRGKPSALALDTCSHGAGRKLGRNAVRRANVGVDIQAEMLAQGICLVCPEGADTLDESGRAYKDIEDVMTRQRDLVDPVVKLRPLGVVKG